ncbi:hypothetical protein PoB_004350900 [Plakobranchus ocellatus]|uniref:MULE transposase domain-containing protein n=1 Tax=Plakobranchus ocellatus TaxID=259542 RepID=A0AAV4BDW3_9GAST|nr:hypothetical protein PoB_004350900 [Plakobranchus ocellatus]
MDCEGVEKNVEEIINMDVNDQLVFFVDTDFAEIAAIHETFTDAVVRFYSFHASTAVKRAFTSHGLSSQLVYIQMTNLKKQRDTRSHKRFQELCDTMRRDEPVKTCCHVAARESSSGAQFNIVLIDFNIIESSRGKKKILDKEHDEYLTLQDVYNIKHRRLGMQGGDHNDIEKRCEIIETPERGGGVVCVGKDDSGGFEFFFMTRQDFHDTMSQALFTAIQFIATSCLVVDKDMAEIAAIETVFPGTPVNLRSFHIHQLINSEGAPLWLGENCDGHDNVSSVH